MEDEEDLKQLAQQMRGLLAQKIRFESERPQKNYALPKEFQDPVRLSHLACFFSGASPYLKQNLFETLNCNTRMRDLIHLLEEEIAPPSAKN